MSQPPIMLHKSPANMDLDESIIMQHVIATHDCNGGINFNANSILDYVEKILNINTDPGETKQDRLNIQFEHIHEELPYQIIMQLSLEILFKSLSEIDCHSKAICLLEKLSAYTWEAKSVMVLAAFALIFGKLNILSQQCHQKRLVIFKQTLYPAPSYDIKELVNVDSIKLVVNLAKCMVDLYQLSPSSPPQSLILASYWIARTILLYAHRILSFGSKNEVTEESTLISKTKSMLSVCSPMLEVKKIEKSYEALLHAFSHSSNNLEVLKLIFNVRDDENIFYKTMEVHRIRDMENQGLLLMITSSTNVSEIVFLARELSFKTSMKIIWIPIVDNHDPNTWIDKNSNWGLKAYMYWVYSPEMITPQFIKFIKKTCFPAFHIGERPIIISLDKCGRLVHIDAFHMILTWGNKKLDDPRVTSEKGIYDSFLKDLKEMTLRAGANYVIDDIDNKIHLFAKDFFTRICNWTNDINSEISRSVRSYNYTSNKEKELWSVGTWSINLVVYPCGKIMTVASWIEKGHYIFLYGGNNTKCVQEFATKAKEFSSKIQLEMKLAYIGKCMKVQSVVKNISDYCVYKNGRTSQRFWLRIQSVLMSRINYLNKAGLISERGDKIVEGLQKLLAYETKGTTVGGWALLSKGEEVIVCDLGDKILAVMNAYETWKDSVLEKGFSQAFKDCYDKIIASTPKHHHPCCALEYPSTLDKIPENVKCPQCSYNMHKFVTFTCVHHLDYENNNFY